MDKWDVFKIKKKKTSCVSKKTFKVMKRKSVEWKKILANYVFHKCLVVNIYKNSYNSKRQITQLKMDKGSA